MPNATTAAAAASKAAKALAKVVRQKNNENAAKFFAAGMAGMMVLFIIFHWTRFAFKGYESKRSRVTALRLPIAITRTARSFLIRSVPGFTSAGHAFVFVGYFATCITISFVNIDWSILNNWAKRLGWVAVSNLALVTFLSLKNTPLAFLTAYSHERLNVLHRLAGYGTIFWSILHAVVYIDAFAKGQELAELLETAQAVGIVAGFAMLVILATSLFLRKLRYEVFYIVHILMFMLILVAVGLHRPDFAKKTVIITIFTACIWVTDRILRLSKISLFSFGNRATITPLPHGGTRIVLRRSSSRAIAGTHAFLWIPRIRAMETHPFTIVSTNPLEFVVAAHDGFTRDLHKFALKNHGKSLRASIDGPYGNVPNFASFNKVVLIAGGSGASFTFGVAIDLVHKLGESKKTMIDFVWVVREHECKTWFTKELQELQSSPLVNVSVHSTLSSQPTSCSSASSLPNKEKTSIAINEPILSLPVSSRNSDELDIEKRSPSPSVYPSSLNLEFKAGRPDIAAIIKGTVDKAENDDRIAVAACGPDEMMQITRKTVADCIRGDGPSVELFLEQFGW